MEKILAYIRKSRKNRMIFRLLSGAACVVFFITTYMLIYPAITMDRQAIYGQEVHENTEDCYSSVLICGLEESEGHQHDDSCYKSEQILTCEVPEHAHGEDCYDEDGNLICELDEHTHTDDCYTEERTLICGQEESEGHQHSDDCYEKQLTCGMEVHTHTVSCYQSVLEETLEALAGSKEQDSDIQGGDAGDTEDTESIDPSANTVDSDNTYGNESGSDEMSSEDVAIDDTENNESEDGGEIVPGEPVRIDEVLTSGTSLWIQNEEGNWEPVGEDCLWHHTEGIQLYGCHTDNHEG